MKILIINKGLLPEYKLVKKEIIKYFLHKSQKRLKKSFDILQNPYKCNNKWNKCNISSENYHNSLNGNKFHVFKGKNTKQYLGCAKVTNQEKDHIYHPLTTY